MYIGVTSQRTPSMEEGSEEMGKGDVLMKVREECRAQLMVGVAKKSDLFSMQMGLEVTSAEQISQLTQWINKLCKCLSLN